MMARIATGDVRTLLVVFVVVVVVWFGLVLLGLPPPLLPAVGLPGPAAAAWAGVIAFLMLARARPAPASNADTSESQKFCGCSGFSIYGPQVSSEPGSFVLLSSGVLRLSATTNGAMLTPSTVSGVSEIGK